MTVVDLNVLLYAINRDSKHHTRAKAWLDGALNGDATVAFSWVVLLGFVRVATNLRVMPAPLTAAQALDIVDEWLALPNVVVLSPGESHWTVLRSLLFEAGTAGNLSTDAHLAALTIEHDAELCSTDADFARFSHLRLANLL